MMSLSLDALSEKINRLRSKSEKNKGRLEQIKEEKKRILSALKADFGILNIAAAKELIEKNYLALREKEEKLQTMIGELNKLMERDMS